MAGFAARANRDQSLCHVGPGKRGKNKGGLASPRPIAGRGRGRDEALLYVEPADPAPPVNSPPAAGAGLAAGEQGFGKRVGLSPLHSGKTPRARGKPLLRPPAGRPPPFGPGGSPDQDRAELATAGIGDASL